MKVLDSEGESDVNSDNRLISDSDWHVETASNDDRQPPVVTASSDSEAVCVSPSQESYDSIIPSCSG